MARDDAFANTPLYKSEHGTGELIQRRWRIEVTDGPDKGRSITREAPAILIGADPAADLALSDVSVSRRHARLELNAEGVLVIDLASRNGTRVSGVRIERAFVPAGAIIRLGQTELRVTSEDTLVPLGDETASALGAFVTANTTLKKVLARLRIVAKTDVTVLLEGEPGTGKSLLARELHALSDRSGGPFTVIESRELVEELDLERVLAARNGTVLIRELGELAVALQPAFLRLLEERAKDVRLIASTTQMLEPLVREKRFREDLYYRVAVVRATILPLRERPEDLVLLAGRNATLGDKALAMLTAYDWPKNVRELEEVMTRAVLAAGNRPLQPDDLFPEGTMDTGTFHEAKEVVIAEFERRYVRALLAKHGNNVSVAAKEAGLSRNALYALMKRADL